AAPAAPAVAPRRARPEPEDPEPPAADPGPPPELPDPPELPEPPSPRPRASGAEGGLERFREELSVRRPMFAAQLAHAGLEFVDGELRISLAASDPLVASQLARPANRELLDGAVVGAFGAGARWRIVDGGRAPAAPDAPSPESLERAEQERAAAAADPTVQAVLDIFGGQIAAVEPAAPGEDETDPGENG
ncbi:MAG TPA: hypothetical protein VLA66_07420, partial [Thermoanaerobaculia bacterium]|nr:hypothetical protein [Thermoanaerobaculia bacterium]